MTTKPIILDTDIGTDVDDCLALALCLASSELKLTAVTTVYGDARLRARMRGRAEFGWNETGNPRPVVRR